MTTCELKCVSIKQTANYSKEHPVAFAIELEVPYDQNSIFWKMSGGTNQVLNTVNEVAAAEFVIGETYVMTLAQKEA